MNIPLPRPPFFRAHSLIALAPPRLFYCSSGHHRARTGCHGRLFGVAEWRHYRGTLPGGLADWAGRHERVYYALDLWSNNPVALKILPFPGTGRCQPAEIPPRGTLDAPGGRRTHGGCHLFGHRVRGRADGHVYRARIRARMHRSASYCSTRRARAWARRWMFCCRWWMPSRRCTPTATCTVILAGQYSLWTPTVR